MSIIANCVTLFLAIVSLVTYGVDLYINYERSAGRKKNEIRNISNKYNTQITPPSWLFMVWIVIYGLLIIWYMYIFYLLICRQLCSRRNKSPLFPGIFWVIFTIINVLNGAWLYLYAHHMVISGIILIVLTLMLYLLNMIAFRICWYDVTCYNANNDNNDPESSPNDDIVELSACEIFLLRLLTLNGLPLYAMWCTIATCLQWATILEYFTFHLSDNVSCIITLSILSFILLIYWHTDVFTKRQQFCYTYLPCILLIVTFAAIVINSHHIGGHHKPGIFFVFILLIVSSFMAMVKVVSLCLCPSTPNDPGFSRV